MSAYLPTLGKPVVHFLFREVWATAVPVGKPVSARGLSHLGRPTDLPKRQDHHAIAGGRSERCWLQAQAEDTIMGKADRDPLWGDKALRLADTIMGKAIATHSGAIKRHAEMSAACGCSKTS
jgi:hypothetical protein